MGLLSLPIDQAGALLLAFARVAGIFAAAPILSDQRVPLALKAGCSFLIALVVLPVIPISSVPTHLLGFAFAAAKELVVGAALGFISGLVLVVVQMAGQLADFQAGFGFAGLVDPTFDYPPSIIGRFQYMLAWLVFLGLNGHHYLLGGVADSFRALPLAVCSVNPAVGEGVFELAARLFVITMKIAAPVIGAVFLADIAIGMVARTVPQMNILVLGFPVKMFLALLTVGISVPVMLPVVQRLVAFMGSALGQFMTLCAR